MIGGQIKAIARLKIYKF